MKYFYSAYCFFFIICFGSIQSSAQYSPVWASYFGGDKTRVTVVKYDTINHYIYIAGNTIAQSGIASPSSHQTTFSGGDFYKNDLFLAKFDTTGQRIWATYYGGSGDDNGVDLAIDYSGDIYISGCSLSDTGIATSGSFMPIRAAASYFLAKFNAAGQRLWGTYYGSQLANYSGSVTITPNIFIDRNNDVILSGTTLDADNIATPGAHQ